MHSWWIDACIKNASIPYVDPDLFCRFGWSEHRVELQPQRPVEAVVDQFFYLLQRCLWRLSFDTASKRFAARCPIALLRSGCKWCWWTRGIRGTPPPKIPRPSLGAWRRSSYPKQQRALGCCARGLALCGVRYPDAQTFRRVNSLKCITRSSNCENMRVSS